MEIHQIQPGMDAIEKLENFITVNRLNANTRIPSERDLCEMWGLNRSTLRNAVDLLVERDLLYRVKGSGVYVSKPKLIRNLVGVTSSNDEIRQQGINIITKIVSMQIIEANKSISNRLKIDIGRKVYEYVRVRIIGDVPSVLETTYFDYESYPDFGENFSERNSMDYIFRHSYNQIQTSGQEKISVTYVSEEEAKILSLKPGEPIFFSSGQICNQMEMPILYYKSLHRADKFKMVSVIEKNG
ncbi:MAG: GntR family transcriptional regulator [Suipraeoptans sp.]